MTGPRLRSAGHRTWLSAVLARVLLWQERGQQRRDLARLEPRDLDDIGVSRSDALREAGKPFWRP